MENEILNVFKEFDKEQEQQRENQVNQNKQLAQEVAKAQLGQTDRQTGRQTDTLLMILLAM